MTRCDQARQARLACEDKAAEISCQSQRGLPYLSAITVTSTSIATLATLSMIRNSVGGMSSERSWPYNVVGAFAEALVPFAVALTIGIAAKAFLSYAHSTVGEFEHEMNIAAVEVEISLLRWPQNDRGKPSTCSAT